MASHFDCIGLSLDSPDEMQRIMSELFETVTWTPTPDGGQMAIWSDASGALLAANKDVDGLIECVMPSFAARSTIHVTPRSFLPDEDCRFCDLLSVEVRDSAGEMAYPLALQVDDLGVMRSRIPLARVVTMRVVALAEEIESWPDDAAFTVSQSGDLKLAPESCIPTGLFQTPAEPRAMLTGHVRASERRVNGATSLPFFWLSVQSLDATYDVLASEEDLMTLPAPGSVIQANVWLVGRVLDGV